MVDKPASQHPEKSTRIKRLAELIYLSINQLVLSTMPIHGVGPIWGKLFKIPLFFYKLGLGPLIAKRILILTTSGRKTGLARKTPLEYVYDPQGNIYTLSAGWGGTSDWFRNLLANPSAHIQIGKQGYACRAEVLPAEAVIAELKVYTQRNPFARSMFSRWIGQPFDDSEESYQKVADFMPMVELYPTEK